MVGGIACSVHFVADRPCRQTDTEVGVDLQHCRSRSAVARDEYHLAGNSDLVVGARLADPQLLAAPAPEQHVLSRLLPF